MKALESKARHVGLVTHGHFILVLLDDTDEHAVWVCCLFECICDCAMAQFVAIGCEHEVNGRQAVDEGPNVVGRRNTVVFWVVERRQRIDVMHEHERCGRFGVS